MLKTIYNEPNIDMKHAMIMFFFFFFCILIFRYDYVLLHIQKIDMRA